jgi:CHAD domain-containing protein
LATAISSIFDTAKLVLAERVIGENLIVILESILFDLGGSFQSPGPPDFMSYQLRHDKIPGDGLRRICRKQIELAIVIATGEREAKDTPVHETRKHLKKARAALWLVRKEIGRGLFRQQNHCLRDVGRLISEIRDAEVRLQTVRQLQGITRRHQRHNYQKLEQMLALELENFVAAFAEWHSQAIPMLKSVLDKIDNWPVDQFSYKQLRRAVQTAYKRGRNALAEAKKSPSMESFHVFRSEAKQLWYHLRILRPVNPVVLNNLIDELNSLGELLGRAHDLGFLGERLRTEHGRSDWQREGQQLLAVIDASQSDLQRGATELGERFYTERPRHFGARITGWLDNWIGDKSPSLANALANSPVNVGANAPT